jgi:hypothetical protein
MRAALAWLITGVWAACYVRKLIDPTFPVPVEITPVMLLAAGWLFGVDVRKKIKERVNTMLNEPEERRK